MNLKPLAEDTVTRRSRRSRLLVGLLSLSLSIAAAVHGPRARAAPVNSESSEPVEAPPVPEGAAPEVLAQARELFAQGQAKFELADYAGAIESWAQAYEILPFSMRDQLHVPLANAHLLAREADGDPRHLAQARAMFEAHLEVLDPADMEARASAEAELAKIDAELARLEAERAEREREQLEQAALARERVRSDREREQLERAQREEAVRLAREREGDRARYRLYMGVGGGLVGLGVASLGAMAAGLSLGEGIDREGASLMTDPGASSEQFQSLRRRGTAYNRLSVATGSLGGALLISGAALIALAVARHGPSKADRRARLRPTANGLEVRF